MNTPAFPFYDVVIIGTGISGLYTAFHIAPTKKVLLISKELVTNCNTRKAKGGMAAALYTPDSPSSHLKDTMKAGGFLNSQKAVEVLTKEVIERIYELEKNGFMFDKDSPSGSYNMGLEGCHSHRRVLHSQGDRMGVAIFNFLYEKVRSMPNIHFLEHTELVNILVEENCLQGIVIQSGSVLAAGKSFFSVSDEVFAGEAFDITRWCAVDLLFGEEKTTPSAYDPAKTEFTIYTPQFLRAPNSPMSLPRYRIWGILGNIQAEY